MEAWKTKLITLLEIYIYKFFKGLMMRLKFYFWEKRASMQWKEKFASYDMIIMYWEANPAKLSLKLL